jgi:hypothetical protein
MKCSFLQFDQALGLRLGYDLLLTKGENVPGDLGTW